MDCSCVRQSLIPGTSKLFLDYLYDFTKVADFFSGHFSDLEALTSVASKLNYPAKRRSALVAALSRQNQDEEALNRLSRPDTVAVVTGQQVGLFSGPAYTIYKALTAVKLSQFLNQRGVSAVPVFWLATEDHDFAEVDHAWMFNEASKPQRVSASSLGSNGGPVGKVRLSEPPLGAMRDALGELPFAGEITARIEAAYQPGRTFGGAFRQLLKEILSGFGLLFLDPLDQEIRQIGAPFIWQVIERAPELVGDLRQRDRELVRAGYHSQVLVEEDTSLLFLLGNDKRTPLRLKENKFEGREGSFTVSELRARAVDVSPNALLRPVMQDYLLPTVSYVAGPAEIAYFAQSEVLYRNLLGRMPVIFPRNSFTLLDTRAAKLLDRYHLATTDLWSYAGEVKSRIAAKLVPPALASQFGAIHATVTSSLAQLESALRDFDPNLQAAAKKSASKMRYQLDKLSRKTARETMLRSERATADADCLLNLIYPQRHLQERFYSIVPFLAKYGLDFPQNLLEQTQLTCPDHMIRAF